MQYEQREMQQSVRKQINKVPIRKYEMFFLSTRSTGFCFLFKLKLVLVQTFQCEKSQKHLISSQDLLD